MMGKDKCPLCDDTGKVIQSAKRTIGYTLAEQETEANTLDEHWVDCPFCLPTGNLERISPPLSQ